VLAAQIDGPSGFPQIYSSAFDTGSLGCDITPCVNFGSTPLVAGPAFSPAWGTDGRLAFGRDSDIWLWTPPVIEGPGTEELVFNDGSSPSLVGNTFAFDRATGDDPEFPTHDVFIGTPGRGITINVEVTDDNPADNRLDLLVDCPGLTYVGAVALLPTSLTASSASWAANFDPSLTCADPKIRVAISDGYNRVLSGGTGELVEAEQKPPTAAIYTPSPGSELRQYDVIPARGGGWDAEDGTLPDANLDWELKRDADSVVVATNSGHSIVDFSPPASGFAPGDYTLTLTVEDSDGNLGDPVTRSFTIVADADNDGLTVNEEALGCVTNDPNFVEPGGYVPDNDPLNAFRDGDNDGIPNVDDPAACTAATFYEAILDIDADSVNNQTSGVISGFITLRYRPITAVNGSSVKISSINGITANIQTNKWSVSNGVGTSKFDKSAVIGFMTAHNIPLGWVLITVRGSSVGNTWSFEGNHLTNVH
jgi:hypothetical protein